MDDVLGLQNCEASLVKCLDGIGITSVTQHLAVAKREEVGTTMPLLTQLDPRVVTTSIDGFNVPFQVTQSCQYVLYLPIAYLAILDGDERGVLSCEEPLFAKHRLKGHALVTT